MNNNFNSSKIYNEYLQGKISKEKLNEYIIDHFSEVKNEPKRISLLNIISRTLIKNKKMYDFLENIITSDENAYLRAKSLEILILNFSLQIEDLLKWILVNDNAPIVIKNLFDHRKMIPNNFKTFQKSLKNWLEDFSKRLKISNKEFLFYLETESLLLNNENQKLDENTMLFYSKISNNNGFSWIKTKQGYIIELHYHFFSWKYLRNNLKMLFELKSLKNFTLFIDTFQKMQIMNINISAKIPKSINQLNHLKLLDLSFNHLNKFPSFVRTLKQLEYLDLSHNDIEMDPKLFSKNLNLKQIRLNDKRIQFK